MCPGNVRSAEGGREPHSPPPEPQAQRLRIVMSNMKRYLCLIGGRKVSADASSVFLCMKRYHVPLGWMLFSWRTGWRYFYEEACY